VEERRFNAASHMEEVSGFSPGGATGFKGPRVPPGETRP